MTPLLALQSHYLTGRLRLKSSSKCLLIDLDTPLSLRWGLVRLQNQIFGFKEGLIYGSQNAVWHSEMESVSLQNCNK